MHIAPTILAALALASTAGAAAPLIRHYPSGIRSLPVVEWRADCKGRRPAVILLYGSAGPDLILNDAQYRRYPETLRAAGFTVFMPYYFERTGTKPQGSYGPAQFEEWVSSVKDAVTWARSRPNIDANRICLLGLSLGAYLGLSVAMGEPRVAALAECYGWLPADKAGRLNTMPRVLILHGQKDVLVPVEDAHALEDLFRQRGVTFESHIYPEQNHGFMGADGDDSAKRIVAFFRERTKADRKQ